MVFLCTLWRIWIRAPTSSHGRLGQISNRNIPAYGVLNRCTQRRASTTSSVDLPAEDYNMAKDKRSQVGRGGGSATGEWSRPKKTMPTHFLCFPIASETTIGQLASSIAHFRNVSTEPARQPPIRHARETSEQQNDDESGKVEDPESGRDQENPDPATDAHPYDPLGNLSKPSTEEASFADSLKVLPSIVHRAPGTYHLTLGVMNLADPAEMEKAVNLFQSLDLQRLLIDAESGPPAGSKAARKWEIDEQEQSTIEANPSTNTEPADTAKGDQKTLTANPAQQPPSTSSSTGSPKSLTRPISPPAPTETPQPLYLSLTSLSTFPSPKRARVIWAKPRAQLPPPSPSSSRPTFDPTQQARLYNFALHLSHAFRAAGLITETRPLVLHATVANMRYKVQAKGGRTSKGRAWAKGRKRWDDGSVDVRGLVGVFEGYGGEVEKAAAARGGQVGADGSEEGGGSEDEAGEEVEEQEDDQRGGKKVGGDWDGRAENPNPDLEFIWCRDVVVDRVAICKMGATKAEDAVWGEWYPPVVERMIFEEGQ